MAPWKGLIRRAALLLVLGVVVSWLVAWGLAVYRPTDGRPNVFGTSPVDWNGAYRLPQYREKTPAGEVFVDLIDGLGHSELTLSPLWVRTIGPEDQWLYKTYPYPSDVPSETLRVFGFSAPQQSFKLPPWARPLEASETSLNVKTSVWGWPAPCLAGVERVQRNILPDGTPKGFRHEYPAYLDITQKLTNGRVRYLPTRVIWLGLAVNAAFWGGLLLIPLVGARSCRLWLRRRRGACPHCGYSREGLEATARCPECGTIGAVSASAGRS